MFQCLKQFFAPFWWLVRSCLGFSDETYDLSDNEKCLFFKTLLENQSDSFGLALRHVGTDEDFNHNLTQGFTGDAVSYAITAHIMGLALKREVTQCLLEKETNGVYRVWVNNEAEPVRIDNHLAITLFDILHQRILSFIKLNFNGSPHHFLLIKKMPGAESPYDIKPIYPTGKCGRKTVSSKHIVKTYSKSEVVKTPEDMLLSIEKSILTLSKPARHHYSNESTQAIIAVLEEAQITASDTLLTAENISRKLTESEVDNHWTDTQYHQFRDKGGYFSLFKQELSHVNEDLDYFKGLMAG